MLASGVWWTVRGPDRDTLARPQDTIPEIGTQPTIRNFEPVQASAPTGQGSGQSEPSGDSGTSGQRVSGVPSGTSGESQPSGQSDQGETTGQRAQSGTRGQSEPSGQSGAGGQSGPTGQVGGLEIPEIEDMTFTAGCPCGIEPVTLPAPTGGMPYLYILSGLPPGLEFDPASRVISGTPLEEGVGTHEVSYLALAFTGSDTESFNIIINEPLDVGNVPDQDYFVGQPIEPLQLDLAGGGTEPYTYKLAGPDLGGDNLPTGLSWDGATRTISGTPTQVAERRMIYHVTDSGQSYTSKVFWIRVTIPPVSVTGPADQVFTINRAITAITLDAATGGDGTYSYAITPALPTGLRFDGTTRVLSGSPSVVSAQTTYTYTARDNSGGSDTATFQITVNDAPSLSAPGAQTYTAGTQISPIMLEPASGGTAPFSYQLSSNLPSGLSFNPSSRVLSGMPTAPSSGPVMVAYTATDANGAAATDNFSITVNAAAGGVARATIANGDGVVSGSIRFANGASFSQLPQGALVTVVLADTSRQGTSYTTIAQQSCTVGVGSCSAAFALSYDANAIDARNEYSLIARIYSDGRLIYINDTVHPVITSRHSFSTNPEDRDIVIVPVP